jgi:hypothetical protein
MTPKEKAKELFDKYYFICQEFTEEIQCSIQAKQCALIAVDEILELIEFNKYDDKYWEEEEFWNEVKHEIEKL